MAANNTVFFIVFTPAHMGLYFAKKNLPFGPRRTACFCAEMASLARAGRKGAKMA
jgi:hypothetical protein